MLRTPGNVANAIHLGTLFSVMQPEPMIVEPVVLEGCTVRLEPLHMDHLPALAEVEFAPAIWRWMPILVNSEADLPLWMEQALEQAAIGKALPWVTCSKDSGRIVGSTRYMDIDARNRGGNSLRNLKCNNLLQGDAISASNDDRRHRAN